jgi:hypothetical protein
MGPIATIAGKEAAAAVLSEAAEELRGRSNRKWAVMLLAFLVGIVVTVVVIKRRGGTLPIESDPRWIEMVDNPPA